MKMAKKVFLIFLIAAVSSDVIAHDIAASQNSSFHLIFNEPPKAEILSDGILKAYEKERNVLVEEEELLQSGSEIQLNEKEKHVHQLFMEEKYKELQKGLIDPEQYAPAMHFFNGKQWIDQSKVFKFIQAMPKGAILHVHNSAAVSSDWVIKNLTYMPGMLQCVNKNGVRIFSFRKDEWHNCEGNYENVNDERSVYTFSKLYDKKLEKSINLYTKLPEIVYHNIERVWPKFNNMFSTISDVLSYVPAYKAFHWRMMEEMFEDNVMYAEVRMQFKELYEDNGLIRSELDAIEILRNLVEEFKISHPGFLGIKIIYAVCRGFDRNRLKSIFETFKLQHALYPDFIIGFDLVGQEDKGKALQEFYDILQVKPSTAKLFFHAGETNWYGSSMDWNLLDAILLNTTRIGHGYALLKHPLLAQAVKKRGIAIEVSPISNQVLHLVSDLRNHPAGYFISQNIPMVITNDDPGFWNAKGLSYDFYYAIMSFAPNNAGLKTLKYLVWSSIKHSALKDFEKDEALAKLNESWNIFIDKVLEGAVI